MDSVKNFVDAAQADEGEWVIGYILCGVVEVFLPHAQTNPARDVLTLCLATCFFLQLGGIIYVILVLITLTIALPLIQVFNILIGIVYDVLVLTYAAGEGARGAAVGLLGNVARQAGRDARGAAGQINAVQGAGKKVGQAAASTKSVIAQARQRLGRGDKKTNSSGKDKAEKSVSKSEEKADKTFERESKSQVVKSQNNGKKTLEDRVKQNEARIFLHNSYLLNKAYLSSLKRANQAKAGAAAATSSAESSYSWFGGLFSATPPRYGGVSTSSDEDEGGLNRV